VKEAAANIETMAAATENTETADLVAKLVLTGTDELIVVPVAVEDPTATVSVDEPIVCIDAEDCDELETTSLASPLPPEIPTVILPRNPAE
jgi:hypothetical protein